MKYRIFSKKHNIYTDDVSWPSNQHTSSDYLVNPDGEVVEFVGWPSDNGEWLFSYNEVDQDNFVIYQYEV